MVAGMSGVEIPTGYTSEDQEDLFDILEDFFGDAATENALSLGLFEALHQRGWCAPGLSPEMAAELQRLRAALDVDHLSNIIRRVDGSNSLGAGVLAEKIVEAIKREIGA